jgi:hypothetical protein
MAFLKKLKSFLENLVDEAKRGNELGNRQIKVKEEKRQKPQEKEMTRKELVLWLKSLVEENKENAKKIIEDVRHEIKSGKKRIEEKIKILEVAEPKVKTLPKRVRLIFEGHRKKYPQRLRNLIEELNLPENFDEVLDFCNGFEKKLNDFSKSSFKNYSVLRDLVGQDAADVAKEINELNSLVKKVNEAMSNKTVESAKNVLSLINEIKFKTERLGEFEIEEKNLNDKIVELKKEVEKINKNILGLENSEEYNSHKNLEKDLGNFQNELKNLESKMFHSFSVLGSALKKYKGLAFDEKSVEKVLSKPIETLLDEGEDGVDSSSNVIELLNKIKSAIISGSLELKDRKKEKSLNEIDKMNNNYFEKFRDEHRKIENKLKETKSKIESITIPSQIFDLKKEEEKKKYNLKKIVEKVQDIKKEQDSIDISEMWNNLEKEILEKMNILAKISKN